MPQSQVRVSRSSSRQSDVDATTGVGYASGSASHAHIESVKMFVSKALERILSEKDLRKSSFQHLKITCESALEELKKEEGYDSSGSSSHAVPDANSQAERRSAKKYFNAFEVALKSNSTKVQSITLDCI